MPSTLRIGAAVAISVALSTASPARAQPVATTPGPLSESLAGPAKEAFDASTRLVERQDFAGALAKLTVAYDDSHDPRLLYDMAVCERSLRHYTRMRALLQRYVTEAGSTLDPASRATVERALAASGSLIGTVTVAATEDGADVSLDGVHVGTTPLRGPFAVDRGKHSMTVTKDGFEPVTRPVEVAGGDKLSFDVSLRKLGATARLTVDADAEAVVALDGAAAAQGHFESALAPGAHVVDVTEPHRRPYHKSIDLGAGESLTLTVTLSRESAPLWPWIAGSAAAAVAGAIVVGYFASRSGGSGAPAPPPAGQLGTVMFSSLGR